MITMQFNRSVFWHRRRMALVNVASVLALSVPSLVRADLMPGFVETAQFEEQERWTRLDSGIRLYVNAPRDLPGTNRTLVIYATPNACTIEQTLGCARGEGVSWRYDIQHVAGQIRRLRQLGEGLNLILAVVQPPGLARVSSNRKGGRQSHSRDRHLAGIIPTVSRSSHCMSGTLPATSITATAFD
jgi:hypothetical protein